MNQIFIKIYLYACIFIIPTANCFASSLSPNPFISNQMNWQLTQPKFDPDTLSSSNPNPITSTDRQNANVTAKKITSNCYKKSETSQMN